MKRQYKRAPKKPVSQAVKKLVKDEIEKDNKREHPLMWTDYNAAFDGDYVKTTPTMVSIVEQVRSRLVNTPSIMDQFVTRQDPTGLGVYKEGKIEIIGMEYQLRFQQNDNATEVYVDTVRHILYKFVDTYNENTEAILNGGDIDQGYNRIDVTKVIWDKIATLTPGTTETSTDDSQFVPGTKIYKGYVKLGGIFTFINIVSSGTVSWLNRDIRFEMQSDDNSTIGEVQVYGYFRIFFRIIH